MMPAYCGAGSGPTGYDVLGTEKCIHINRLIQQNAGVENFPEQFIRDQMGLLQPDHVADAVFEMGDLCRRPGR